MNGLKKVLRRSKVRLLWVCILPPYMQGACSGCTGKATSGSRALRLTPSTPKHTRALAHRPVDTVLAGTSDALPGADLGLNVY